MGEAALERPAVGTFLQFLFENYEQTSKVTTAVVPLTEAEVQAAREKVPDIPPAPE